MDLILAIQKDRSIRQLELDAPALATLSKLLKAVADDYLALLPENRSRGTGGLLLRAL
jgi:hypothetical protein